MNNSEPQPSKGSILIVDDTPANLRLLSTLLSKRGYRVRPTLTGPRALSSARKAPPDLILLDIMMPDMDGYEVCRHLKADERTREVPVIFISALDQVFDKVTAFSVGGVDYIAKPFQAAEVLARVHTHLTLADTRRRLQEKNGLLARQNKELDAFAHTVAHDLKNPLSIITGYIDVLARDAAFMEPAELEEVGQAVRRSAQKAVAIVDGLLLLASVRKGTVRRTPLDMQEVINQAQERLEMMIAEYQGEIILPATWPTALGYARWIEEVWVNYLSNGLKYGGTPPRLEVGATSQTDGMVRFWVQDNGAGLTPQAQAILFTEFTRLNELPVEGHGLGLSIVRRIVHKLGGQVGVESEGLPDQGSLFYFTLPEAESPAQRLGPLPKATE